MTRAVILSPTGPPAELIPPLKISFSHLLAYFGPYSGREAGKMVTRSKIRFGGGGHYLGT